jgi:hypothetical protein
VDAGFPTRLLETWGRQGDEGGRRCARGQSRQAAVHDGAEDEKFEWMEHAGKRVRVLTGRCVPMPAEPTTFEEMLRSGEVVASPRSAAWATKEEEIEVVEDEPQVLPLQFPRDGPEPPCTQMTLFGTPAPCARPSPASPVSIWGPSERDNSSDGKGGEGAVEAVLEEDTMQAPDELVKDIGTPTARATTG